jgi:hypothetical protein
VTDDPDQMDWQAFALAVGVVVSIVVIFRWL